MTIRWLSFLFVVVSFFTLSISAELSSNTPDEFHNGVTQTSSYITVRDGVKIAVDVLLPKGLPKDSKLPTILDLTRYWRNNSAGLSSLYFVSHGYAMVLVDVRGTGASSGVWSAPFSDDELADNRDIVNWVVAQPWCNGKIGAIGVSYEGATAQFLAVSNHPAVKAVIPRFQEFDEYTDLPFPGGIFADSPVKRWQEAIHHLDNSADVEPVESDKDYQLLKGAIKDHGRNLDVYKFGLKVIYRDDKVDARTQTMDSIGVPAHQEEIEQSKAAIYGWGGWLDAVTADAVIDRFLAFSNPQKGMIGPWNHGGSQNASPYLSPFTPDDPQLAECLRYFDHYVKGIDNGIGAERELVYYTMGEEKWKSTSVWPPVGSTNQVWYLGQDHTLSQSAPQTSSGADTYKVDYEATTGKTNRWQTEIGGGHVDYPNRAPEDARLLTYTSPPLPDDIEITGAPVVDLYVTSTHTDGAFFVYLEDVDDSGKVIYLTEGELRAIHRKISSEPPPYRRLIPFHTFKQKDGQPLAPGQVAELKFGLLTTSVLVKKGHRIRVAIAGADKDTFARIPAEGTPQVSVARNAEHASWIQIPVIKRPSTEQTSDPWQKALSMLGVDDASAQRGQSQSDTSMQNDPLPTVDQIIDRYVQALGGRDAIEKVSTRVTKGFRITSNGVDELLETYSKEPDKTYTIRKSIGIAISGSIGRDAWTKFNDEPARPVLDPNPTKSDVPQRTLHNVLYLKDLYSEMKLKGIERIGDKTVYLIEAVNAIGYPAKLYFDIRTGLLMASIQKQKARAQSRGKDGLTTQESILADIENYFDDYRSVGGVMVPFLTNSKVNSNVTTTILTEVRNNVPIDDAIFKMPK